MEYKLTNNSSNTQYIVDSIVLKPNESTTLTLDQWLRVEVLLSPYIYEGLFTIQSIGESATSQSLITNADSPTVVEEDIPEVAETEESTKEAEVAETAQKPKTTKKS